MGDISKELLFVRALEKVRQIAKGQGNYIRKEQVTDEFAGLDLSESQLGMVFEYLAKYGIVDETSEVEEGVVQRDTGSEEIFKGEEALREKESKRRVGDSREKESKRRVGDSREKESGRREEASEEKESGRRDRAFEEEKNGSGEGIIEENDDFRKGISLAADQAGLIDDLTEEERDYLQTYLDEIAALPVYEKEELEASALAAVAGDTKARERLMESFLRDVADIAKLYVGQGVLLEDLIGEGNMALAMGLQTIGGRGQKGAVKGFSEVQSLLVKQVMDAMEALVRENAANQQTDQKVAERVNLVADKAKELAEELRRKVTPEELAEEAGLSVKAIQDAMRMSGYKIEDITMI